MLDVLYEDNHIIAVNKLATALVQGDKTGDKSLDNEIKANIAKKYNKPGNVFLGVVHRLDRPVGGVIVYARTSKALSRLNQMFRDNNVKKSYLAVVKDCPPQDVGTLVNYLKKNEKQNKSYVYDNEVKGSKKASLSYKILGRSDRYYLLEVDLHSGRHHQIRAQLANIGCPIRGDLKYGYPRSNGDGSISLFAKKLEFIHPVGKETISIVASEPDKDVWKAFKELITFHYSSGQSK